MFTTVVKTPDKPAEVRDIETDDVLAAAQKLVGGYVECVSVGPGVHALMNEEGLALNLPDNCGFVGTILFIQDHFISEEEGYDWGSLDEENCRKALAWCGKYDKLIHPDRWGGIHVITGDKEIADYREQLAKNRQAIALEWQSL